MATRHVYTAGFGLLIYSYTAGPVLVMYSYTAGFRFAGRGTSGGRHLDVSRKSDLL